MQRIKAEQITSITVNYVRAYMPQNRTPLKNKHILAQHTAFVNTPQFIHQNKCGSPLWYMSKRVSYMQRYDSWDHTESTMVVQQQPQCLLLRSPYIARFLYTYGRFTWRPVLILKKWHIYDRHYLHLQYLYNNRLVLSCFICLWEVPK